MKIPQNLTQAVTIDGRDGLLVDIGGYWKLLVDIGVYWKALGLFVANWRWMAKRRLMLGRSQKLQYKKKGPLRVFLAR